MQRTTVWITSETVATNSRPKYQHRKAAMETTTKTTFTTVGAITTCSQQGILSFQASQPIKSGNNLSVSTNAMKCFLGN